jgi:hypothetical protein
LGEGAGEERAETERARHAQEENDVSRRSEEDCSSPTSAMGEAEVSEEDGVGTTVDREATCPRPHLRKTLRKQFLKNRLGIWV